MSRRVGWVRDKIETVFTSWMLWSATHWLTTCGRTSSTVLFSGIAPPNTCTIGHPNVVNASFMISLSVPDPEAYLLIGHRAMSQSFTVEKPEAPHFNIPAGNVLRSLETITEWQKVDGVHKARLPTPSVSPPVLGEKNGPHTGSTTPKRSCGWHSSTCQRIPSPRLGRVRVGLIFT